MCFSSFPFKTCVIGMDLGFPDSVFCQLNLAADDL